MDPTIIAGLALAGLAAYGMPGLSEARPETHAAYSRRVKKAFDRVRASRESYQSAKRAGDPAAIRKAKQKLVAANKNFYKITDYQGP